jgi:hypothetical protein
MAVAPRKVFELRRYRRIFGTLRLGVSRFPGCRGLFQSPARVCFGGGDGSLFALPLELRDGRQGVSQNVSRKIPVCTAHCDFITGCIPSGYRQQHLYPIVWANRRELAGIRRAAGAQRFPSWGSGL